MEQNTSNNLNVSSNATNSQQRCALMDDSSVAKAGKIFASCSMLVLAVMGNFFITVVIYRNKKMRKTIHYFVVNMACSDLIFSVFVLPRTITELGLAHQSWLIDGVLGLMLCKLVYFFQDISTAVSIQSLVLIAVDRFGAVVFPVRPPLFGTRVSRMLMAATWILAMAIYSPCLIIRQLKESSYDGLRCYVDWKRAFGSVASYKSYIISLFLILVVVPFALLAVLYTLIILKVKHQAPSVRASVSRRERRRRFRQERNVLKMALAIVTGFVICMAPLNIYIFMFLFLWQGDLSCGIHIFRAVAFFFFYANCAINPCIFFVFSEGYRKGLKAILHCSAYKWCTSSCLRFYRKTWTPPRVSNDTELNCGRISAGIKLLRFSRYE